MDIPYPKHKHPNIASSYKEWLTEADQILSIIKAEVDKLEVISEHKPIELIKGYPKCCEESWYLGYCIGHEDGTQAQLQKDIKELKEKINGDKGKA